MSWHSNVSLDSNPIDKQGQVRFFLKRVAHRYLSYIASKTTSIDSQTDYLAGSCIIPSQQAQECMIMSMMISVVSFVALAAIRQVLPRLIIGLLLCSGANAAPPDTQADIGYAFDDNVTRANEGGAKRVDRSYVVNLSQPFIFPLADHERALLTGSLGGEIFDLNKGLNHLTETALGELQYRGSAEFGTPTFALFAKIAAEQYQSYLRDGFRYSAGISIRQPVTDRIRLFGVVAHNVQNGKSTVFDNKDNSARINLDYSLINYGTIYLGGEYRRGDVVISGAEHWSTNNPNAYTLDDAFYGDVYSFRFDGTTVLSTLGYNRGVGPRSSIDFSWKRARSSVNYVAPSLSNAALSYLTNQYSLVYLVRF